MGDVLAFELKGPDRDLGETQSPEAALRRALAPGSTAPARTEPSVSTRRVRGSGRICVRTCGGFSTLSSAQIVERPHHGTSVTSSDGMIHFRTNSGFIGKDYMTVRYKGTCRKGPGVRQQATMPLAAG